jgi:prephenate dehydrogenase
MQTVAIVGVGLIGASFGLALRATGFEGEIIGVSSQPAIDQALAAGAISSPAGLEDACRNADLIYLSQTVDRIVDTLPSIAEWVRRNTLVTDAGSTKVSICKTAGACLSDVCFVGGHPLAGKEQRGAAAADANLFRDRPYVLTPVQGPPSSHLAFFHESLRRMGAAVLEVPAEEHDEAVAFTSHLPQLVSTALAGMLGNVSNAHFRELFGPGLVDMTRLALSSPELWSAILQQNRDNVLGALETFQGQLINVKHAVAEGRIQEVFETGRQFAAEIRTRKTGLDM